MKTLIANTICRHGMTFVLMMLHAVAAWAFFSLPTASGHLSEAALGDFIFIMTFPLAIVVWCCSYFVSTRG